MAKIAELDIKVGVDGSGVGAGLRAAIGQISNAQNSAMAQMGGKLKSAGGAMVGAGTTLTAGLTAPIVGMTIASTQFANAFNRDMANVASLIPGAGKRVQALKKDVQDLAVATGTSTTDIAQGLYQVISAFGDGADTTKRLDVNVRAAAAGLATVSDSLALTSAVTKAYGDTSGAAVQKAADLGLLAVRLGQTTFPELAGSIGRVTPVAKAMGVSQEELFAVMATGSGVTGGAAEVATQMRGALKALMAPTADMAKLLKQQGFASGEAMVKQLGFVGSIQRVVQGAKQSGQPLQKFIGEIEGQTLALALADSLGQSYQKNLQAMGNSAGTLKAAFGAQTEGVDASGFALRRLNESGRVFMQDVGDALAPALISMMDAARPLVAGLGELVKSFTQLPKPAQTTILAALGVAAALGPILIGIGSVVSAVGSIMSAVSAVGGLGGAIAALSGPVGWIIGAVVAIGAGLVYLWKTNEGFRTALMGVWQQVSGAVMNAVSAIGPFLGVLMNGLKLLWDALSPVVVPILIAAFQLLGNTLSFVFNTIGNAIKLVTQILTGDWAGALETSKAQAQAFTNFLLGIFRPFVQMFQSIWKPVKSLWKDILLIWQMGFQAVNTALYNFTAGLFLAGQRLIMTFVNGIKSMVGNVVSSVKGVFQKIRNLLPFSDAKTGPLSDLTASGRAFMTAFAGGMTAGAGAPLAAVTSAFGAIAPSIGPLDTSGISRGIRGVDGAVSAAMQGQTRADTSVRVWVDNGNIRAEMVDTARGVYRVERSADGFAT